MVKEKRFYCVNAVVNVLQSMILTDGEKMLRTPTWHVFNMYKEHQDADLVYSYLTDVKEVGNSSLKVPEIVESTSVNKDGVITATLSNLSLDSSEDIEIVLTEKKPESVNISILNDRMNAYNTFEEPDKVKTTEVTDFEITDRGVKFTLPACSVISISIK